MMMFFTLWLALVAYFAWRMFHVRPAYPRTYRRSHGRGRVRILRRAGFAHLTRSF
jgi:hypothetical protein